MESYIKISNLNDFIFCPRSIYFHGLYAGYKQSLYHQKPQIKGKLSHKSIDKKKYSTAKKFLQSLEIFCQKYNLCGKIDLYDIESKTLIERKTRIKKLYDGYKYQLYAQYFCLLEMGYEVERLFFHSLDDNRRFEIDLPDGENIKEFEELLQKINSFDLFKTNFEQNIKKCEKCIYAELCDFF